MDQIHQAVLAMAQNPIAVLLNGVGGLFLFLVVVRYLVYRNPSE